MKIGIIGKSNKKNERRYPLHWKHINDLTQSELNKMYFEEGYPDLKKINKKSNILSREKIFEICDLIILPKPDVRDYKFFKENQILWGWAHAVQGFDISNTAIKNKMTLIAWENMYIWNNDTRKEHIFLRNNEIAGYAALNHYLSLLGITPGLYGEGMKVAVLGYGSTAKGSVHAALGLGTTNITVFSKRSKYQISDAIKNVTYKVYEVVNNQVFIDGKPSHEILLQYDLIINCVLQNPLQPIIFLKESEIKNKQLHIIDVSCDKGMGFDFATPTSFENPIIETDKYIYYSVDHTPSYFWNAASYEISGALMPYLRYLLTHDSYKGNVTLERAIDIESGIIKNKSILIFQNRKDFYPYKVMK